MVDDGSGASGAEERRLIGRWHTEMVVVVIGQRFRSDVHGSGRVMMNSSAVNLLLLLLLLLLHTIIHHGSHFLPE